MKWSNFDCEPSHPAPTRGMHFSQLQRSFYPRNLPNWGGGNTKIWNMYLKTIKQPTWLGCSFSPSPGHHSAAPIPSHTWCIIFLMMNSETGDKFLRTCGACPWSLWSQPARFLTRWSDEGHGENKIGQNRLKMVQGCSPENDNPYCTAPACPSAARSPVAACSSTPARGRNELVDQTEEKPTLRSLFFISACSSCVSSSCSSSLWQTTNVNHECSYEPQRQYCLHLLPSWNSSSSSLAASAAFFHSPAFPRQYLAIISYGGFIWMRMFFRCMVIT